MVERRCIVTRDILSSDFALRFVADPRGIVVADIKGILPGRGVWLTCRSDIVAEAVNKNLFSSGLRRRSLQYDSSLVSDVDSLLESRALGSLSMCRKAGRCVWGNERVKSAISSGDVVGLSHAIDASENSFAKLRSQAVSANLSDVLFRLFSVSQHDLSLGLSNIVQLALLRGDVSTMALNRFSILRAYRGMDCESSIMTKERMSA